MNAFEFHQWCSIIPCDFNRKPLIMGILNVTPDSFSDGGRFLNPHNAYKRAQEMIEQGADIIDVGGESSRPGAVPLSYEEELARVIPVIKHIREESDICISIDTYKVRVMEAAVETGANLINDIRALTDIGSLSMAAQLNVPVCLMHMQGLPLSMQDDPRYSKDVITEINEFFFQRIEACLDAGISKKHLILDPGFGFGKTKVHNLTIVKNLQQFQKYQLPLLLGTSRKQTIGEVLNKDVLHRMIGGLTLSLYAALQGVSIIRTHDVSETKQALTMLQAIQGSDGYE